MRIRRRYQRGPSTSGASGSGGDGERAPGGMGVNDVTDPPGYDESGLPVRHPAELDDRSWNDMAVVGIAVVTAVGVRTASPWPVVVASFGAIGLLRPRRWVVWVGLALLAGRWVNSMLFGVEANDPATLTVVLLTLLGTASLAAFIPARRSTRIDPMITMRAE